MQMGDEEKAGCLKMEQEKEFRIMCWKIKRGCGLIKSMNSAQKACRSLKMSPGILVPGNPDLPTLSNKPAL